MTPRKISRRSAPCSRIKPHAGLKNEITLRSRRFPMSRPLKASLLQAADVLRLNHRWAGRPMFLPSSHGRRPLQPGSSSRTVLFLPIRFLPPWDLIIRGRFAAHRMAWEANVASDGDLTSGAFHAAKKKLSRSRGLRNIVFERETYACHDIAHAGMIPPPFPPSDRLEVL